MLKKLVRFAWAIQPRWLRRSELKIFEHLLRRRADPNRPLKAGDIVICGLLGTASGLGQGARQMLDLLRNVRADVHGANASRFAVLEDFDAGALWPADAKQDGVIVFHINPDIFSLVAGAIGPRRLLSRYMIGIWAWELPVLPAHWVRCMDQLDEIWVSTHFIADAVRKAAPNKAVSVFPYYMNIDAVPTVPRTDPLPQFAGRRIVFFMYDVRSVHARKNPEAVIEAFRRATVNDADTVLVLKINNAHAWPESLERVERAMAGLTNVHIMHEKLSIDGMKDLMARVDVVMSLHRSEGFGLLMAEAMAAARPVIATGWSGNVDFMPGDCTVLVDYKLVPIIDPQNIYDRYDAMWADPDIDQAAKALRRLLDDPAERARLGKAARESIAGYFAKDAWMKRLPPSFWKYVEETPPGITAALERAATP